MDKYIIAEVVERLIGIIEPSTEDGVNCYRNENMESLLYLTKECIETLKEYKEKYSYSKYSNEIDKIIGKKVLYE